MLAQEGDRSSTPTMEEHRKTERRGQGELSTEGKVKLCLEPLSPGATVQASAT